jgi:hypothetical protein
MATPAPADSDDATVRHGQWEGLVAILRGGSFSDSFAA